MIPGRKIRLRHVETKEELEESTARDLAIDLTVEIDVEEEDEPKKTGVRLKQAPAAEEEEERTTKWKNRSEVLGDAVDRLLALSEDEKG
ncbi:MAG TPA: hypothetical protein VIF62_16890 [Labilithrix sp.]|jgi:hypothetical protein